MSLYPVLVFDYKNKPLQELADNIWQAQKAGHPKILTYCGPLLNATGDSIRTLNRKQAMRYEAGGAQYRIPLILSRDEYPFACTVEGGGGSWIGHIPPRQNSAQGGLLASFIRANGIVPVPGERSKFEVRVINHPGGPVK